MKHVVEIPDNPFTLDALRRAIRQLKDEGCSLNPDPRQPDFALFVDPLRLDEVRELPVYIDACQLAPMKHIPLDACGVIGDAWVIPRDFTGKDFALVPIMGGGISTIDRDVTEAVKLANSLRDKPDASVAESGMVTLLDALKEREIKMLLSDRLSYEMGFRHAKMETKPLFKLGKYQVSVRS